MTIAPRAPYRIQTTHGEGNWIDPTEDLDDIPFINEFPDIDSARRAVEQYELCTEKIYARIVDDHDKQRALFIKPYEGVTIDVEQRGAIWLDAIREDYGLEEDLFLKACKEWIAANDIQ